MKLSRILNKSLDELLKSLNEIKPEESNDKNGNNAFKINIEKWNEENKNPAHKIRIPRWMSNQVAEYNSTSLTVDDINSDK